MIKTTDTTPHVVRKCLVPPVTFNGGCQTVTALYVSHIISMKIGRMDFWNAFGRLRGHYIRKTVINQG